MKLPNLLILLGSIFVFSSLIIITLTFYPLFKLELSYDANKFFAKSQLRYEIKPIDRDFGIVVPKIGANSAIVANVDPFNEREYQWSLTKGIAHAKGTTYPGQTGNVFLFSHSAVNFFEAGKFNAVFYLLYKLDKGDKVELYYKGEKFVYIVTGKKVVNPNQVEFLKKNINNKELTLMTCTPPGTNFKRLLVFAKLQS